MILLGSLGACLKEYFDNLSFRDWICNSFDWKLWTCKAHGGWLTTPSTPLDQSLNVHCTRQLYHVLACIISPYKLMLVLICLIWNDDKLNIITAWTQWLLAYSCGTFSSFTVASCWFLQSLMYFGMFAMLWDTLTIISFNYIHMYIKL